jgi:hypothetical protein
MRRVPLPAAIDGIEKSFAARPRRLILAALLSAGVFAAPVGAATIAAPLVADTYTYSFLNSTPLGLRATLYAMASPGHTLESYLRFDVPTELQGRGSDVIRARLELDYTLDLGDDTSPAELRVHQALSAWDEQLLSWDSRQPYGPVLDAVTGIDAFGPIVLDVTALARAWLDGSASNYGVVLTNPTARQIGMHSREASVDPQSSRSS